VDPRQLKMVIGDSILVKTLEDEPFDDRFDMMRTKR